jgi:hypothetical protein
MLQNSELAKPDEKAMQCASILGHRESNSDLPPKFLGCKDLKEKGCVPYAVSDS